MDSVLMNGIKAPSEKETSIIVMIIKKRYDKEIINAITNKYLSIVPADLFAEPKFEKSELIMSAVPGSMNCLAQEMTISNLSSNLSFKIIKNSAIEINVTIEIQTNAIIF